MAHLGKSSPQSDQASTFVISSVGTASPTFLPMPSSATTTVCSPTRSDEALFGLMLQLSGQGAFLMTA